MMSESVLLTPLSFFPHGSPLIYLGPQRWFYLCNRSSCPQEPALEETWFSPSCWLLSIGFQAVSRWTWVHLTTEGRNR